jgi:L-serine dehydratase
MSWNNYTAGASGAEHRYGSLAKTGKGHGTDIAILMGLDGEDYTTVDTSTITARVEKIKTTQVIHLKKKHAIPFVYERDLIFEFKESLPYHS